MYFGGKVLGSSAKSWSQLACTSNIADAKPMQLVSVRKVDDHDLCATYRNLEAQGGKPSASSSGGAHNVAAPAAASAWSLPSLATGAAAVAIFAAGAAAAAMYSHRSCLMRSSSR